MITLKINSINPTLADHVGLDWAGQSGCEFVIILSNLSYRFD